MKGSFQLIKLFNIPVLIHWTFLLIFVWLGYTAYSQSWDWESTVWAFSFLIALFTCVVLHEFGHALTARYYGVDTRDIILSPIGGVARLDRLPEQPTHEFMVAIAGPLVNVAIGIVLSIYALITSPESHGQFSNLFSLITNPGGNVFAVNLSAFEYFLFGLIALNLILALFNMLPAFPMDGGRVLRSLLSIRLGRVKATKIASYIGQGMAVLLIGYGVFNFSLITAFIGIFVFVSAANEYKMVRVDGLLEHYSVREVVRTQYTPLYASDTLSFAIDKLGKGLEKNFLVLDEWHQLRGTITEKEILESAKKHPEDTPVGELCDRNFDAYLLSDPLKDAFPNMQWRGQIIAPVYNKGQLAGVLERQTVYNFLNVQQKLKKSGLATT